jgi:hypothetical protein
MGININAVLYFGFPFLWSEDYDMDEKLHERLSALVDEDNDAYPECGKKENEVNLGTSGDFYNGHTVHYVYIIGTEVTAGSWDVADLSAFGMVTPKAFGWRRRLKEFCDKHGIPWQEPGWKMTAKRS